MTARPDLFHDLVATFEAAAAPRLPLDEWVSQHRVIVTGARRGKWNPKNAPMALEPMRALSSDDVRAVVVISPSQLLKTELAVNAACWTSDYGDDCLFYEPDQPPSRKNACRPGAAIAGRDGATSAGWRRFRVQPRRPEEARSPARDPTAWPRCDHRPEPTNENRPGGLHRQGRDHRRAG